MKLIPTSLVGRLLLGAGLFTAAALAIAAVLIGLILQHFILGQIDQRLDAQIAAVGDAIEIDANGTISMRRALDGPPFDRVGSGWYWQVSGEGIDFRSRSLGNGTIDEPPRPPDWRSILHDEPPPIGPPPWDAIHIRSQPHYVAAKTLTITASAPRGAILGPIRQAMLPLLVSLLAIGIGLALASLLQVRLGLRPLKQMQQSLRDVRAGRIAHVPAVKADELAPLATELNALIDQNAAGLAVARQHVANLAHGLKTPLATLSMELNEPGRDPDGSLRPLVAQIEGSIRHHLGRARAAALGGSGRLRTPLLARLSELSAAMRKIHVDRSIDFSTTVDTGIAVACEGQDLDEMLGNLLDNAFKWARTQVSVEARRDGGQIVLSIDDDGAGLPPDRMPEMLLPGRRLDEAVPGHGFGLSITRELVELYGGSLTLETSPLGGLRALLRLPLAET